LAIESDSSQDKIVAAAELEECIVVRGPPGTGKSQVIVNLISNALAYKEKDTNTKQKRILVVCQKRAALDVVYQRLDKIGLVKYIALLHDPNKDRKSLYQHMDRLLKSNATSDSLDQEPDSALIYCCQQIDDVRARQNSIVTALSKKYFGGVSIRQLYSVAKPGYLPKLDLSGIAEKIEYPILTHVLETARNLEYPCKKFDIPTNYPWRHRNPLKIYMSKKFYMIV
jgi:hypothetical protein